MTTWLISGNNFQNAREGNRRRTRNGIIFDTVGVTSAKSFDGAIKALLALRFPQNRSELIKKFIRIS